MQFLYTSLSIDLEDANTVIETSDYQLFANNIATIHWDLISSHFVLVPEEN